MNSVPALEIKDLLLSNSSFGPREIEYISLQISNDYSLISGLREAAEQMAAQPDRTPATSVRLGICQFLLGHYTDAIATLQNSDSGALAYFYRGKSQFSLGAFADSIESYENASRAGYNKNDCLLAIAEAKRHQKDHRGAMDILDNIFGEQTAEYLYQRGATLAMLLENSEEVCMLYERALTANERHAGALFGLALENERRGNDEKALELYQRGAGLFPTHVGILLNLGLLYEDHDQYDRATRCYDRILESHPTHPRARLFRNDSMASMDEDYDHERERARQQIAGVMNIPIAQFELSVRSRNCLQKMGILTLGDLCKISELDLLNSKNFGETSLVEIREMMANKGLVIGQLANQKEEPEEQVDFSHLTPDEQALLERPMSDLNLSVRARKCMTRLGLTTIGELARKSPDDLLECKNFGVTSLTEIREKLGQIGLKMRGE